MNKTLLLLRHAKSSWDDPSRDDLDRPLNARGQNAAPRIGTYMKSQNLVPDLVLCSPARRATETWALVHAALGNAVNVKTIRRLYLASPSRLLQAIRRAPDHAGHLLVIAHNPGIQELAIRLGTDTESGPAKALNEQMRAKFPTAALAILTFEVDDWTKLTYGGARLQDFVRPKQLP